MARRKRKGRPSSEGRTTKTEAVMDFVKAHSDDAITAGMVADSIGLDRKVTATLLARLASEGRIFKVGRGRYSTSRRARGKRVSRGKRMVKEADARWRRAFEEISKEVEDALGPAATRLRRTATGKGARARTERLVKELRRGMGPRLALDVVQPILEEIFGENGREMAARLCGGEG